MSIKKGIIVPLAILLGCFLLLSASNDIRPTAAASYPRALLQVMSFMSVLLILVNIRSGAMDDHQEGAQLKPLRAFIMLGFCVFYAISIHFFGYYIATAAFLIVAMIYLGMRNYVQMAFIILGINLVAWYVFALRLHIMLPTGVLLK
jgi:hypothetical protein